MKTKNYIYYFLIVLTFLLGLILRAKGFLTNPSMWHDECALAWNIKFKNYSELFSDLRFFQVAPPLFLVFTKFVVSSFNALNNVENCDLLMRLLPFVCGLSSMGIFYLTSKELFAEKKAVLMALMLFCFNVPLIDYSYEFKPYIIDVFITLLLLLFFLKVNLAQISYKKLFLISIACSLTIFLSLPSCFITAAGGLVLFFKYKRIKKLFILLLPSLIGYILYIKFYIFNIYQHTGIDMSEAWTEKFIVPNFSNFMNLFLENLQYFFFPVKQLLFLVICLLIGLFIYFREKKYTFSSILLLNLFFVLVASILHIYPFYNRLIIFFIPMFILLIAKIFDNILIPPKIQLILFVMVFLFILVPQIYFATFKLTKITNKGEFPREMVAYIAKNIKSNDKIFVNKASRPEYCYYSSFYNIKNKIIFDNYSNNPDSIYLNYLNSFPKGNYWLFLAYDYSPQRKNIEFVQNWAKNHTKILQWSEATQSSLIYVKK